MRIRSRYLGNPVVNIVYGLLDPDTLEIRYVGKTSNPERRYLEHVAPSRTKSKTYRGSWLKSLFLQNKRPGFVILERNVTDANEAEMRWIRNLKSLGARLVNGTEGGDGWELGKRHSEQSKTKMHDSHVGKYRREDTQELILNAARSNKPFFVSFIKRRNKWRSYFYLGKRQIHLGYFNTRDEAMLAYDGMV